MCDKAVDTILLQYNLFLNAIRFQKCVIKQFIDFFVFDSIPDQYETQKNVTCFFISSFKSILPC